MEKFTVEGDRFPRQEIEAENAENAAWEYCGEHQMEGQMIKTGGKKNIFRCLTKKIKKQNLKLKLSTATLSLSNYRGAP